MNRWIAMSILCVSAGLLWQLNASANQSPPTADPNAPADRLPGGAGEKSLEDIKDQDQIPAGDDVGSVPVSPVAEIAGANRTQVLIASLTIFMLAVFVGFEVITKVPPTLHTPLMSGSNAISGITIVGALLVSGGAYWFASLMGFVALVLATINVVGGFLVTHRMLAMFSKPKPASAAPAKPAKP